MMRSLISTYIARFLWIPLCACANTSNVAYEASGEFSVRSPCDMAGQSNLLNGSSVSPYVARAYESFPQYDTGCPSPQSV
jgi:hypothetical protein